VTEDEAKAKWCPFARVANRQHSEYANSAGNRWLDGDELEHPAFTCMGSACMAWRWDGERRQTHGAPYIEAIKAYREGHHCDLSTAKRAVDATWVTPSPTDGYCGLAGAVQ